MAGIPDLLSKVLNAVFGPSSPPSNSSEPSEAEASSEFPSDTLRQVAQARLDTRRQFESERAQKENDLGLSEKSKRLERARAYLKKAGADQILGSVLRHTWYWDAWKEKGELDDLPRYGVEVPSVRPKETLDRDQSVKGYTVLIEGRAYDLAFLDKGRSYTPDGYGGRYGAVSILRAGETVFSCSIDEVSNEYYSEWKPSLWGLTVLTDVAWLPDFAKFSELLEQRNRAKQQAWADKRVIEQADHVIDPTTG